MIVYSHFTLSIFLNVKVFINHIVYSLLPSGISGPRTSPDLPGARTVSLQLTGFDGTSMDLERTGASMLVVPWTKFVANDLFRTVDSSATGNISYFAPQNEQGSVA